MKKYAILASVLALAACGGGGSGSGGAVGGRVLPTRLAIRDITAMDTAIVDEAEVVKTVNNMLGNASESYDYDQALEQIDKARQTLRSLDKTGVTDENLDDVITALKLAGLGYTVPENADVDAIKEVIATMQDRNVVSLIDAIVSGATKTIDDVDFNIIGVSDNGTIDGGTLQINTKGANITAIRLVYNDKDKPELTMIPTGGNKFKQSTGGAWRDDFVATGELVMFGKNQKLKYADFGYYDGTLTKDDKTIVGRDYLAGGYELKHVDKDNLSGQTMTFTGTAVASVFDGDTATRQDMQDDTATLTFNDGTETLDMHFDDWYNVKVSDGGIEFTGTPTDENLTFTESQGHVNFDANYYGDNGTPTEATARFDYVEGKKVFIGAFGGHTEQ